MFNIPAFFDSFGMKACIVLDMYISSCKVMPVLILLLHVHERFVVLKLLRNNGLAFTRRNERKT